MNINRTPWLQLADPLRADWQSIANDIGANVSLFPDWQSVAADSHRIAADSFVLAATENQQTSAVLPLRVATHSGHGLQLKTLGFVSNWISYHNEAITRLGPQATLSILLDECRYQQVDMLHIADLCSDSPLAQLLESEPVERGYYAQAVAGDVSPYLQLDRSWEDLLSTKPKKFRYKLRKRAELLVDEQNLHMRWLNDKEHNDELLEALQIVETNSWKHAAGVSIFTDETELRYHQQLLPFLSSIGALQANVLYEKDKPIAYNICCIKNGWAGQLKTSFDSRYAEISPGSMVIDHAIENSIKLGAAEFDFLGQADSHKLAWTKESRRHTSFFIYLNASLKGKVVGVMKRVRDTLRAGSQS